MIDAHQHFWELGRNDCTWPSADLPRIHRDYRPDDLCPLIGAAGVTGTVLVQSQPSDRDTDYLCALADAYDWINAVVGWADLASPASPARIAELARRPKMRGLRPMLQDLPDDAILDPAFEPAVRAMLEHGFSLDALVRLRHLPHLRAFAAAHPGLPIVIDHAAKPGIERQMMDPWRADIRSLAALPNVYCKLSGLVSEAGPDWHTEHLQPYVTHLLDCFGPRRLMWGSDWPVVEMAADYPRWLRTAQTLTAHLDRTEVTAVFHDTACDFYRLQR
jgi:L-fuconolactonase